MSWYSSTEVQQVQCPHRYHRYWQRGRGNLPVATKPTKLHSVSQSALENTRSFHLCLQFAENIFKNIGLRMALEEFTGYFLFPVNFRCHPQSFWYSTIFVLCFLFVSFRVWKMDCKRRRVLGNYVVSEYLLPSNIICRTYARYLQKKKQERVSR